MTVKYNCNTRVPTKTYVFLLKMYESSAEIRYDFSFKNTSLGYPALPGMIQNKFLRF